MKDRFILFDSDSLKSFHKRIFFSIISASRGHSVVIGKKNRGINSSFTIRKISYGEGVERVFPLFSANIDKIEVIRKGNVKRAKLYYLRDRTGKSARIAEKIKKKNRY